MLSQELVHPAPVTLSVISVDVSCRRYCTDHLLFEAGPVIRSRSAAFPSFWSFSGKVAATLGATVCDAVCDAPSVL